MDIWLTDLGLHDGLDGFGVQNADGDVLGNDLLVLATQGGLKLSGVKVVVVIVIVGGGTEATEAKWVIRGGGRLGRCRGRGRGGGCDGHGEDRKAVLFSQAQGGGYAVERRLQGTLQRLEGKLEVDCVGDLGGLDVEAVKYEVHREGAEEVSGSQPAKP